MSVGAGAVGAESPSMAGPGIVVRRDLLVECTVGYFGDCELLLMMILTLAFSKSYV